MKNIFNLEALLKEKIRKGDVKVYSFKESMKIYRRINEGLPEFQKEQSRRDRVSTTRQKRVFM